MVRRVATAGDIGDVDDFTKGVLNLVNTATKVVWKNTHIVQTGSDEEIGMLVITSASPKVSNLLGLDVGHLERGAVQRRRGNLQDGQRRGIVGQRLSDTRDLGDQRRKTET
jgi:hypothetical protein